MAEENRYREQTTQPSRIVGFYVEPRIRLEQEGWEFLTNENPMSEDLGYEFDNKTGLYSHRGFGFRHFPYTDEELAQKYRTRNFADVLITEAFDINGNFLPTMRAVYVKRTPIPEMQQSKEK